MADLEEQARLLRILEGHGQSFLASFEAPTRVEGSKKRKADKVDASSNKKSKHINTEESDDESDEEEEEWLGIGHDRDEADSCSEDSDEEDKDGTGDYMASHHGGYCMLIRYLDFEHSDSEFTSAPQADSKVVVFADPSTKKSEVDDISRVQMKAFMVNHPV